MGLSWMRGRMPERYDSVLPESGGLMHLASVHSEFFDKLEDISERSGETFLHPEETKHVRKALRLLASDDEAKATIMSLITFAQMKHDCAN